jgi:RNA-binding protein NOB1
MNDDSSQQYRFLVVDSGPIIRLTGVSTLFQKAQEFYTVPAVLQEIRDAKARRHLENLPFELKTREPSADAVQAVVDFSRQTGDYQSLSSVDLQVLALLYELEREGCQGDMDHVRKTPKRVVGLGKVENLGKAGEAKVVEIADYDVEEEGDDDESSENSSVEQVAVTEQLEEDSKPAPTASSTKPMSWATLVNPSAAATTVPSIDTPMAAAQEGPKVADQALTTTFGSMNLSKASTTSDAGQFSDAEDDEDVKEETEDMLVADGVKPGDTVEHELQQEFPSLAAALHVPYEGSDDEAKEVDEEVDDEEARKQEAEEARKKQSLKPISKSGRLYNTLGKYKKLARPKAVSKSIVAVPESQDETTNTQPNGEPLRPTNLQSRIIGGAALAGQEADFEDDGEGWITTMSEIEKMKNMGVLDPKSNPNSTLDSRKESQGPHMSQRAACTTTDFAMQNVILQMNLELLSVDGVKVRKLKSWVQRCGACYKVYTNGENTGPVNGKRLFCERCGSDMIQRIACSVDGKTGRLRLHLSKKYKHNLRGTKFSLPKPGSGNRFQGDLLLAEDQLMTGAWNQKVKMRSGGKAKAAAQSMFGRDIASNVGCNTRSITGDDVRVGFGTRNPNSVKGRERRGKKKKSDDKACGLRRY